MTVRSLLGAACALFLSIVPAPVMASAPTGDLRDTLQAIAKEATRDGQFPGIIILVDRPTDPFTVSVGTRKRDGGDPLSGSETLRLGSITKTYIAALAVQLAREGAFRLDAPISSYLERSIMDRLPRGLDPTVRQLLNHSSGIPDYYSERFYREDWKRDQPLTPELALHAIRGLPSSTKPGARFDYSNTNYQMLALVMEAATGQPVDRLIRDRLIAPLDLTATYFDVPFPPGDTIHGYGSPFDPWEETFAYRENSGPDGGMFASASDVAKWLRALFAKDGAFRELGLAMVDNPLEDGPRKRQGMGVEIIIARSGEVVVGHTGSIDGYLSAAFYVPAADTVLVIHANRSDEQAFGSLVSRSLRAIVAR